MPSERAAAFAALHRPGNPLILFNAWDAGSAKAVAEAGAPAIATGSASVAAAYGFADAEALPLDLAIANAARVVAAVDLPVTIDFEGGYAVEAEPLAANMKRLAGTGAVGPDFFINARTDLFLKAKPETHDGAMVDAAIERAHAYAEAGASGFFAPLLADLALLDRLCAASPLPVNFMAFPGAPTATEVAAAGVARISHGPFPYMLAMKALKEAAEAEYRGGRAAGPIPARARPE